MSDAAITLSGVGKMYKIFSSRKDRIIDSLGLGRALPWWRPTYREFWALRGIDLEVAKGQRMGIIGRNGAGKSSLLRLITGNVPVTEGELHVDGSVQALIEAGGGFHPEFTGRENIAAALLYQGHSPSQLRAAEEEISEFTELDAFLDQPFKTYSLGMQARLTFAVATAVRPEILIVDEMLGAGDAYFMNKSTERMQQLVKGGATVLLVSHSLEQVMLFCEEAIWLERGRVVKRGPSMEVCKAYEKFTRELNDKRLKAKNAKLRSNAYSSIHYDTYADSCTARFTVGPGQQASLEVSQVRLLKDGELDDGVLIGDAQDADRSQSAQVVLDGSNWSAPQQEGDRRYRSLTPGATTPAIGDVFFNLYALIPDTRYELEVTYRGRHTRAAMECLINGVAGEVLELDAGDRGDWQVVRCPLGKLDASRTGPAIQAAGGADGDRAGNPSSNGSSVSRWRGQGSLLIEKVRLLDGTGAEQTVFEAGRSLKVEVAFRARSGGEFSVIPVAVLFRRDGVLVSRYIGEPLELTLAEDDVRMVELPLDPLRIGNGYYVFTIALYKSLDVHHRSEPEIYDLLDRSFEFEVYGSPALKTGIFLDTAEWRPRK